MLAILLCCAVTCGDWLPRQSALAQAPPPAAVQVQAPLVSDIRVQGVRPSQLRLVKSRIQNTRVGRPFDPETVEQDVRRLVQTRRFINVETSIQPAPGGLIVIFQIVQTPTLEHVQYVGNRRVRSAKLAKETGLKVGGALDPYSIEEARRKIEDYYSDKGYGRARVTVMEGNRPSDRGAIFLINEGDKQSIWKTKFIGNTLARDDRLRTLIQSKPGKLWLFGGQFDRDKVDSDRQTLTDYYRNLGYFDAHVGGPIYDFGGGPFFDLRDDHSWVSLTFVINEGQRYSVRNLSIVGNTKFDSATLSEKLQLATGDFFNRQELNRDVLEIQDVYGSRGYIFAAVEPDLRYLEEAGQVDLVFQVEEGDQYVVGRVNVRISGDNPHTKLTTVHNRLSLKTGDIVDIRKLRESEIRLSRSGLFEVDPTRGNPPKIVFQRPEESDRAFAERTGVTGGVRGQSPDHFGAGHFGAGQAGYRPQPTRPGVRVIDLDVYGTLLPEHAQPASQPVRQPAWGLPGLDRIFHWSSEPAEAEQLIIRGQSPEPAVGKLVASSAYATDRRAPSAATASLPISARPRVIATAHRAANSTPSTRSASNTGTLAAVSRGSSLRPVVRGQSPPLYQLPPGRYPRPWSTATQPTTQSQPLLGQFNNGQATPGPAPGSVVAPPPGAGRTQFINQPPPGATMPGVAPPPGGNVIYPPGGIDFLNPNAPRPIDITALLDETQTGRFMFGVGVNSDAGVVGNIVIDERNFNIFRLPTSWADFRDGVAFRGAGQQLRIEAVPGTELNRYVINFREPYLFDSLVSLGLSGFFFDRRFQDWDEERLGGRVSLGYQFPYAPDLSVTASFRGESVNISNPRFPVPPQLAAVMGDNAIYSGRVALAHDTRDNTFLPTQGHLIEIGYEQVFGDFDYPRGTLEARQYFLIRERPDTSGRHVLSVSGQLGISGNQTPVFENFFAGGFSTLRGFDFRGASPRSLGVFVGGQFQLLGSVEYMLPLTADDMLRGVIFCDFGTVEESVKLEEDDFRVAPGFGLRITVPALSQAPIALDFAFPIAHEAGDDLRVFSFFVGFAR